MKLFNASDSDNRIQNLKTLYGESRFVYHVAAERYSDLRSRAYQTKVDHSQYKGSEGNRAKYYRELNFFAGPVSSANVKMLRDAGFSRWGTGDLYLYKVDLLDVLEVIAKIDVTSTPEQSKYDDKNWDEFYSKNKDKSDEAWFSAKKVYLKKRDIFLEKEGIKNNLTVEEYMDLVKGKDWWNLSKYVKINVEKGNVEQYASYIPHVQLDTNGPVPYASVKQIV